MAKKLKVERDAYFTPRETSQAIVDYLLEKYPDWRDKEFYEPSAGDGSFLDACKNRGLAITGADIYPMREDILQVDFLEDYVDLTGKIIIGNPPYGFKNAMTVKFINRAFELGAEKVAFLLLGRVISANNLSRTPGVEVEHARVALTKFSAGGVESNMNNLRPLLVIYGKASSYQNFKDYKNGPYLRYYKGFTPEDFSRSDLLISGSAYFGLASNFPYRDAWGGVYDNMPKYYYYYYHASGRKNICAVFQLLDPTVDLDRARSIVQLTSPLDNRGSAPTLNYWLSHLDRLDLDPLPIPYHIAPSTSLLPEVLEIDS